MDTKNISPSSSSVAHKLTRRAGVLKVKAGKLAVTAKEKENVRKRLVVTAKKLAETAKEKEAVRKKLAVIASKLAITAKEKESIRNKLAVTAEQLAATAKEKEDVREKLEVTAENLSLKAKQLALIAEEKENVKRKLVVTAKEKENVRKKLALIAGKLAITAKEKEDVRRKLAVAAKEKESIRNKLVITAEQLAATAKEKEDVREKLEVTAENLSLKAKQLALIAEEKENVKRKLVVTAKEKENVRKKLALIAGKLAITAKEKEDVRRKLAVTARNLKIKAEQLIVTAKEKKEKEDARRQLEVTAEKLKLKAKRLAVTVKEKENVQRKLIEHTKELERTRLAILNILEDLRIEKQSLAKAKVKDEAVLESIGEGVIATDKTGVIILINRVAETLLGDNSREALGKKLTDVINLEDEKGNKVLIEARPLKFALSRDRIISTTNEYSIRRNDGTKLPVALTVAPIILKKDIIGAVEVFRDITKEKEIDQAKSEFVSIASHQLRTPLTGIHWLTELLQKEKLTAKAHEFLSDIQTSVKRLNALVELLLNISRIEEGKIEISPQSLDVVSFIKMTVDSMAVLSSKKKLSLTFTPNERKIIALTDVGALQNIAQSILSNAIEYTPNGGKIEVKLKKNGHKLLLTVSDTGIGIPAKDQKRIFQKFSRASNAERNKPGGMGMGLWITKQATELLGGKIWFKSPLTTGRNKGTAFFVELPLKSKLIKGTKKFV